MSRKVDALKNQLAKNNFGIIEVDYRTVQVGKFTILNNGKYYQIRKVSGTSDLRNIPCVVFTRINSVIDYLENN